MPRIPMKNIRNDSEQEVFGDLSPAVSQPLKAVVFENIFESADEAILIVEPTTHHIQMSNPKAVWLFGSDVEQPGRRSLERLFPLVPVEQLGELWRLQDGDSIREVIEVLWTDPRGAERWLELRGILASFRGRNTLLVHARDVPVRRHLADKLEHDINNVLQGTRMCCNALTEEFATKSGSRDLLQHIDSSIESAQQLTRRLVAHCLDLERLAHNRRLHSNLPGSGGDVAQLQVLSDHEGGTPSRIRKSL
jgi:PAS domain-containing protein